MSYIEIVLNNCLYLLCPLALYLLYTIYKKNLEEEQSSLMFEVAVISSLYFILRYGLPLHNHYPTMLFDIPLLLCFFKKKTLFSIFIAILLILYQTLILQIQPVLLIIEYLAYFGVYFYHKNKTLSIMELTTSFVVVTSFFLSFKIFAFINPLGTFEENLLFIFFIIFIIYSISILILSFFDQGEKIVDFNHSLYNIEKEKQLRTSLFKVTHEIKNPIAVCKGYLDMLDLDDKKKVHKYIPIIKEEINRTLILMDDYLDYTKIKIKKEEIDLIMLLEEIEHALRPLFLEKDINFTLTDKFEECYLEADYNRLKQVFINLLKNAVEARDVTKKEMKVQIEIEIDKKELIIFIRDNGIGMTEEELKNIGEMFFTTKQKGTGLGTSLSKEIIELHHGTIKYNSEKQKGTEVKITLPMDKNMS